MTAFLAHVGKFHTIKKSTAGSGRISISTSTTAITAIGSSTAMQQVGTV